MPKRRQTFDTRVKKVVKRYAETKFHDYIPSWTSGAGAQAGDVHSIPINAVLQGSANNQRVGDEVDFTSLTIRGVSKSVDDTAGSVTPTLNWRIIVFRDLMPNGVAPGSADVMFETGAAGFLSYHPRWENRRRFSIISDVVVRHSMHTYHNGTNAQTEGDQLGFQIPISRRDASFKSKFKDSSPDAGAFGKNAVFILVYADPVFGADQETSASLYLNCRMTYKDV